MKYRKKPVVIEAMQYTGDNFEQIEAWATPTVRTFRFRPAAPDMGVENSRFEIETLEGTHNASPGDWIIKGVNGEFYPCKPDIFDKTYELAEASRQEEPTKVTASHPLDLTKKQLETTATKVVDLGDIQFNDSLDDDPPCVAIHDREEAREIIATMAARRDQAYRRCNVTEFANAILDALEGGRR